MSLHLGSAFSRYMIRLDPPPAHRRKKTAHVEAKGEDTSDTEVKLEYINNPVHGPEFVVPPNSFGQKGVNESLEAVAAMWDEEFLEAIDGVIRLGTASPTGTHFVMIFGGPEKF